MPDEEKATEESTPNPESSPTLTCNGCGARLTYLPGTRSLTCAYCGSENPIADTGASIDEMDYRRFLEEQYESEERVEVVTVHCEGCGATVTLDPDVTSDRCPYCSTALVVSGGSSSLLLKPRGVIPFQLDLKKARESFRRWLGGLWFAPSDLKRNVRRDALEGVYLPYWTYDAATSSSYDGQRGEHYTVMERSSSGQMRQVRRTRWMPAAGMVDVDFDDVLVAASRTLEPRQLRRLEPWYLGSMEPLQEDFLRGFRTQTYQVEPTEGMETARAIMEARIREAVRRDIGGDEQRIQRLDTTLRDIRFKPILLPVWISSFRYGKKIYRFLINGQTGEVQGKRPYSWFKIIGTLLGIALVIVILAAVL